MPFNGGPARPPRTMIKRTGFYPRPFRMHAAAMESLRPETPDGSSRLGEARAVRVLADAVLPVLLLDAEQREDPAREAAVLDAYDSLPAAADRITRPFADLGLRPRSAAEAQGVHQLARGYCEEGRCARCAIGRALYPALDRV